MRCLVFDKVLFCSGYPASIQPRATNDPLAKHHLNGCMLAQFVFINLYVYKVICNSYTMGCPPVRGDNPRALASELSYVHGGQTWYNYFMLPTSVKTLHIKRYFVLNLVRVV